MKDLKGIVHQKNREIMTGRIAIGALLVICLVLCAIIFTAPSRFITHRIYVREVNALGGKCQNQPFMPLLIKPSSS